MHLPEGRTLAQPRKVRLELTYVSEDVASVADLRGKRHERQVREGGAVGERELRTRDERREARERLEGAHAAGELFLDRLLHLLVDGAPEEHEAVGAPRRELEIELHVQNKLAHFG